MSKTIDGVDALIFNDCTTLGGTVWSRSGGAYRLATELRKLGLRVQVVDFFSHIMLEGAELWQAILDRFVGRKTLFVGLSTSFLADSLFELRQHDWSKGVVYDANIGSNRKFSSRLYGGVPRFVMDQFKTYVKQLNPTTALVGGGANALKHDLFWDVLCRGYGETHMVDYVKWRLGKNPFFQSTMNGSQMVLEYDVKAEKFSFTDSQIMWQPEDCIQPDEALPIEISRGCIFKCKFCYFPLNGKAKLDFIKEPDVLREELTRNYELFGTTRYMFSDDTYNDTTTKLQQINSVVQDLPFKVKFGVYARLDLMVAHKEHAELMLENGIGAALFGIESLNHESARSIGKGMHPDKLVKELYRLRDDVWKTEVFTHSSFIVGLPYDTYDTMGEWLTRISDPSFPLDSFNLAPLSIDTSRLRIYTSEFEQDPKKYGYDVTERGWTNASTGTSLQGCNELVDRVQRMTVLNGRQMIPPHLIMNMPALGFSLQQARKRTLRGLVNDGLYNRTNSLFVRYISQVLTLPTS